MIKPTTYYCYGGWVAPNGDYYGLNDEDIQFIHIGISNTLVRDNIIPESRNPDKWLELNGWIKQHGNHISVRCRKDKPILTQNQANTLYNILHNKYSYVEFINQEVYLPINKLLNIDEWTLHYELIT